MNIIKCITYFSIFSLSTSLAYGTCKLDRKQKDSECGRDKVTTHANGGGTISLCSINSISKKAFIDSTSRVCGTNTVIGPKAKLKNRSFVYGGAHILGETTLEESDVYGLAKVSNSTLSESRVYGASIVKNSELNESDVYGKSNVEDSIISESGIYEASDAKKSKMYDSMLYRKSKVKNSTLRDSMVYGKSKVEDKKLNDEVVR